MSVRRALLLLLVAASLACAQEPSNDDLKRENEALKRKVAELETQIAGPTPPAPAPAPAEEPAPPPETKKPPQTLMGEVVVTATRGEAGTKTTGSAISTVSRKEMEQQHADEAMEPLRGVPGVAVTRTGTRGGLTSVFTRGLDSNHTLFLLEGFELTRDGGQFFELDTLTTDAIGGIEVLRGPQSALYGSDAMGGVVNFRLPRGEGPGRIAPLLEFGSFATNHQKVEFAGGDAKFGYNLVTSRIEQSDGRFDHSNFENYGATGRFDVDFSDKTRMMAILRTQEDNIDLFSNFAGPRFDPTIDPDDHTEKDTLLFGFDLGHWVTDWWDAHVQLERYSIDRDNFDVPDTNDPFGLFVTMSEYTKTLAHIYNRFYPCKSNTITFGGEFEDQELDQLSKSFNFDSFPPTEQADLVEEDRRTRSVYLQDEANFNDLVYLTAGVRYDDNDSFGGAWTGRVAGAVWIDRTGTKPRASFGTAVVEPTFFQTFDPHFGSAGLSPERNEGWDAGVDQWLCDDRFRASVTYFHNHLSDVIQFETTAFFPVFDGTFVNAGRARTEGVEAEVHWDAAKGVLRQDDAISTSASYTWTETEVLSSNDPTASTFKTGGDLIRRPRNLAHLNVDYSIVDRFGFDVDFNYFGSRRDVSFVFGRPPREIAHGYLRVDLASHWDLPWVKGMKIVGRCENLFDKDYDEVLGFPGPGVNFLGGVEYEIGF